MENRMTRYVCTDKGQHKRTRLGRFTSEHVKLLDQARAEGDWFVADMRDHVPASESVHGVKLPEGEALVLAILETLPFPAVRESLARMKARGPKTWETHPRRRTTASPNGTPQSPDQPKGVPPPTGRLVFRGGHGVGILKCPRCGGDKRLSEERLRAALTAEIGEVDISLIGDLRHTRG
jgi:hypothetical protein